MLDIKEVIDATNKYKKDNDFYQEYIDEFIEEDKYSVIIWSELLFDFNRWYMDNYKKRPPKTKEVKKAFIDKKFLQDIKQYRYNNSRVRGWKGYVLITEEVFSDSDSD